MVPAVFFSAPAPAKNTHIVGKCCTIEKESTEPGSNPARREGLGMKLTEFTKRGG